MHAFIASLLEASPNFASEVKGASPAEIAEMEKLAGVALPADYRAVLELLGSDPGPVKTVRVQPVHGAPDSITPIDCRLASVVKRLRKGNRFGVDGKRYLLIGLDRLGNDNGDFFLDLHSPKLAVIEWTETLGAIPRSPSLFEFFFGRLFARQVRKWDSLRGG